MQSPCGEPENEVRNAILDAADRLFEQFGYRKTTVEEIALEAKIGKGSVYLHFSSKEDLGLSWLKRLHKHILSDMRAIADDADERPSDKLQTLLLKRILLRFDVFTRHRRSMDEAMVTLKEAVHEKREAFHCEEAKLLASVIRQGIAQGDFKDDEPDVSAESMVIATNSLLPYSLKPTQLGNRDCVESRAKSLAKLLARAISIEK